MDERRGKGYKFFSKDFPQLIDVLPAMNRRGFSKVAFRQAKAVPSCFLLPVSLALN